MRLWSDELGFSNWLHLNIGTLGAALNLELESIRREAPVGRLSADIQARIAGTEAQVIIENQIFHANHRHFGQVLTYAAEFDASVVVWIATTFRSEYRKAFMWLNSLSKKRFYAVELSTGANGEPHFAVVAGPTDARFYSAGTPIVAVPPSQEAYEDALGGWYVPTPFGVPTDRNTSPGQLALNSIFELIGKRLAEIATFPRLRKPASDRNYYVVSSGPVPGSEWSVVFTNDDVRLEAVFNKTETAVAEIERMASSRAELEARLGASIDFDVNPTRQKQKAIIHRRLTYHDRDRDPEGVALWCADTIAAFADAVSRLDIYRG